MRSAEHSRCWFSLRPQARNSPSLVKHTRTSLRRLPAPPQATDIMSGLRPGLAARKSPVSSATPTVMRSSLTCAKRGGIFTFS
jgi:hypothetical protein